MKTSSTYKMSKQTKRTLAVTSKEKYDGLKALMIDAEVAEIKAKQAKIKTDKSDE